MSYLILEMTEDRAMIWKANGNCMRSTECCYFQWHWLTFHQYIKVTPVFDAEYLRNGTRYRHSYYELPIGSYALLWMTLSNFMTVASTTGPKIVCFSTQSVHCAVGIDKCVVGIYQVCSRKSCSYQVKIHNLYSASQHKCTKQDTESQRQSIIGSQSPDEN